jgi:hypothetical protein
VARHTQGSYHRKLRNQRVRVHGVKLERAVASLAAHSLVGSAGTLFGNIVVALLAHRPPCELQRNGAVVVQRTGPVVAQLAEVGGNQHAPEHQKPDQPDRQETGDPDQVLLILEKFSHARPPSFGDHCN